MSKTIIEYTWSSTVTVSHVRKANGKHLERPSFQLSFKLTWIEIINLCQIEIDHFFQLISHDNQAADKNTWPCFVLRYTHIRKVSMTKGLIEGINTYCLGERPLLVLIECMRIATKVWQSYC